MAKSSRTERLLALSLLLLEKERPLSRSDIRAMVLDYPSEASDEAFEKMFERDKDELRSLGFPIETVEISDTEGIGYILKKSDARLGAVEFSAAEKAALSLAARLWTGGVNQADATHALKKLEAAAGGIDRFESAAPVEYVAQDPAVDLALMRVVEAAVSDQSVLAVKYCKPGEPEATERTVSPWGLVIHGGTAYLVGHDHVRAAARTFKLARIAGQPRVVPGAAYQTSAELDPQEVVLNALTALEQEDELDSRVRRAIMAGSVLASVENRADSDDAAELANAVSQTIAKSKAAQLRTDQAHARGEFDDAIAKLTKLRKATSRRPPQDSSTQFTRILAIVPWLVNNPGVPTAVAAQEFGVSVDQLVKDLNLAYCTEFGSENVAIDLYIHSTLQVLDPQGIDRPLRFSVREAYALQLGLLKLQQLPGLVERDAIFSAQDKLAAASGVRTTSIQVSSAVAEAAASWESTIEQGIANSELIQLAYVGSLDSSPTVRIVEPAGISSVAGQNYLVAWCREAEGVRHFRFDRIQDLKLTGDRFEPVRAEADTLTADPFGSEAQYATLRVAPAAVWWTDTIYGAVNVVSADGSQLVSIPFGSMEWISKSIAGFGGDIQLLDPSEAVDNFRDYLVRASL